MLNILDALRDHLYQAIKEGHKFISKVIDMMNKLLAHEKLVDAELMYIAYHLDFSLGASDEQDTNLDQILREAGLQENVEIFDNQDININVSIILEMLGLINFLVLHHI